MYDVFQQPVRAIVTRLSPQGWSRQNGRKTNHQRHTHTHDEHTKNGTSSNGTCETAKASGGGFCATLPRFPVIGWVFTLLGELAGPGGLWWVPWVESFQPFHCLKPSLNTNRSLPDTADHCAGGTTPARDKFQYRASQVSFLRTFFSLWSKPVCVSVCG